MTPSETIAAAKRHWMDIPIHVQGRTTEQHLIKTIQVAEHLLSQINSKPETECTTYSPAIDRNARREME